jgi:hypothetical protein
MARKVEEEATIIDASPLAFVGELKTPGKGRPASVPLAQTKREPMVVDAKSADPPLRRATEYGNDLASVGGEDDFILAWGRSNAAVKNRGRQLLMSTCLNVCMAGVIGYLAWRNEQKETYVFVRDSLGNVVQADAQTFLHAGDARTEAEIKGFMRRWVFDAYSWTPLDVEDRLRAALRLVETKAQPAVKAALGLAERKRLVESGTSGRVHDRKDSGKEAQVVITRSKPLEVMVGFDRYLVDRSGTVAESGHVFLRAHLKEVPRSPGNPSGLLIVDTEISERL